MKSKFSPKFVIRDFFKFHKNDNVKIIGFPLFISCILIFFVNINMELVNILLISLSIFIGFLLNLMLLSFNLKDTDAKPTEVNRIEWNINNFLIEYHVTISFELLITVALVIILLLAALLHENFLVLLPINLIFWIRIVFNFLVIFLISLFFLLIFRVLKFGFVLIKYHLEN
ncbi:hypothetical protein [Methanobrevibacter millerae]|uniref:Uncharacterized protein n=1 Tax=Methanobrevibacter millerae TaxID=230361 RepID=A0A1G5WFS3_9EURY|nr:hypothetical protein [Methanobrevibacter millerae]SDA57049.1 hypothetical protein SAMN02910315_01384 [Methanobrevibacter millerae]